MDRLWEGYLEGLADILGRDSNFDITTLSKPSGPLGAALYMQWYVIKAEYHTRIIWLTYHIGIIQHGQQPVQCSTSVTPWYVLLLGPGVQTP